MILWILLAIVLLWLVLWGAYLAHGRKGVGETFPCGHPRKVCGVEAPVCPICKPYLRGNPAVLGRPLFDGKIDGVLYLTPEQMKEIRQSGKWQMVCRSCGKPMGAGGDTCSDCYGDPHHPAG